MDDHGSGIEAVAHHRRVETNPKYFVSGPSEQQPFRDLPGAQNEYAGHKPDEGFKFEDGQTRDRRKRLCGCAPRIFWITAIIMATVIIAAAVGGGVGGSLSSKSSDKQAAPSSSSATSTETLSARTSTTGLATGSSTVPVISTRTTMSSQYTLLSDCPSSNWTTYNPSGTSQVFRKACTNSFVNVGSDDGLVNQPTSNLDACIGLCAAYNVRNATQIVDGSSVMCTAVCWRATIQDDDHPGFCFGYLSTNISGNFNFGNDERCNGAALIN